jgi:Bacterial alpha-L-rhamnosidase 6 hairpin glycosidase domain/Alpha-L-rhamnosidase N-terminal domain/Bacterial alpha-L-rhamnosidase concanavalin-like domain/Bacterial alpha-L-rhamnosidase C-terminal domain
MKFGLCLAREEHMKFGLCLAREGHMKIGLRVRDRRWLPVVAILTMSSAILGSVSQAAAHGASSRAAQHHARGREHDHGRSSVVATALRVDALTDPIGLGDASPTLSWSLRADERSHSSATRQTAYQIRVASSPWRLGHSDLWDSGKVLSGETRNIGYGGAPLQAREDAVWQVRVWDGWGRPGRWSAPAVWEMGLLSASDWSAKWIEDSGYTYATNGVPNPLPIFGKSFDAGRRIVKARLYATGLGQYAATLNGSPVTNAVLEPGQTSYWAEVDYRTYDVTRLLRFGSNVLGIETGSGVYQQADSTPMGRYMFQPGNNVVFGAPKVIAQLEITYADGSRQTIATDPSWLTRLGATTFSSWWGGEDYDAQRMPVNWTGSAANLSGPDWRPAGIASLNSSTIPRDTTPLVADPRPPVTVVREAHPTSINQVTPPADNTTLVAPVQAGSTNVRLASVTNLYPGDTINIDTAGAMESRKVTAVGTAAGPATTLAAPAAAGDTNIKVTSVGRACNPGGSCAGTTSFIVGQTLLVDSGSGQEAVTVTSVGTAGATGSGVTFTPALTAAHAAGTTIRDSGTGVTVTPALGASHADGTAAVSLPGPTYVLDFGANLSGLAKISGSAPAGTTVTMIPAEEVNPDGTINVSSTGASPTSQILYHYTFSGHGFETWRSQFTYNGFQYLEVRGLPSKPTPDTITLLVTHASNRHTAWFTSSSSMLNTIYQITERALENNMQSVLTDCPDREKGPYTGDNVQDIQTDLTLFDMQAYEAQLVANMRTSQRPTPLSSDSPGLIANIAPEFHVVPPRLFGMDFLDEPNWAKAVIVIPWELYRVYGDTRTMSANYDAMVKWLDYEAANKQANGGNIPGLGDWSAAQSTTPQAVIDYGYYNAASTMARIAQVLGKASDAAKYSALAASLASEYNTKYLHTDGAGNAWYANNTEAANAVALDAGLVPPQYHQAVVNSLVAAVQAYGDRIGTGSVALGPLFRSLHDAGRDDLIYQMVTNPNGPSYAFLVNQGATTLWESLSGPGGSHDHQFLGDVDAWLVHDVVGIDQAAGSTEYRQLLVRPAIVGDLTQSAGTFITPQGRSAARWERTSNGRVAMTVTIPANTTAEIWVPTSGQPVRAPRQAKFSRFDAFDGIQYAVYNAGPGSYQFNGRDR